MSVKELLIWVLRIGIHLTGCGMFLALGILLQQSVDQNKRLISSVGIISAILIAEALLFLATNLEKLF